MGRNYIFTSDLTCVFIVSVAASPKMITQKTSKVRDYFESEGKWIVERYTKMKISVRLLIDFPLFCIAPADLNK